MTAGVRSHALDAVDLGVGTSGETASTRPTGRPSRPRPQARRRRRRRVVAIVLVALLVPVTWSYVSYLTAPGSEPIAIRSVDWLRDHGFESVVNRVEGWYYTRHEPKSSAPARKDLPTGDLHHGTRADTSSSASTTTVRAWIGVPGVAAPPGSVQESWVVPDPQYPSVAVALVRLDQAHLRTVYVPGLREPGGIFAWHGGIPAADRPHLVAAFNAGFKMRHITGGVFTEGRIAGHPLQPGQASLVIDSSGRATVAQWGRDASMGPGVVSVRQNLALIVDGGKPVGDLLTDRTHKWGTYNSQLQFTWRSGLGVDAQGRLIYAAGRQMRITQLAQALADAGAVRAMQLDIHDSVVTFNWFRHSGPQTVGSKLMSSMPRPADRFLAPDWRDFFAVETR